MHEFLAPGDSKVSVVDIRGGESRLPERVGPLAQMGSRPDRLVRTEPEPSRAQSDRRRTLRKRALTGPLRPERLVRTEFKPGRAQSDLHWTMCALRNRMLAGPRGTDRPVGNRGALEWRDRVVARGRVLGRCGRATRYDSALRRRGPGRGALGRHKCRPSDRARCGRWSRSRSGGARNGCGSCGRSGDARNGCGSCGRGGWSGRLLLLLRLCDGDVSQGCAADNATKAVVLAANMPADRKQRRPGPLSIALGIELAGCEKLSMVMLSVFLSCAVRVSLTGTSGTDEARRLGTERLLRLHPLRRTEGFWHARRVHVASGDRQFRFDNGLRRPGTSEIGR